jgi:hypothetical protein
VKGAPSHFLLQITLQVRTFFTSSGKHGICMGKPNSFVSGNMCLVSYQL